MNEGAFTFFVFFNDTATTEIYTLSLHDALPISPTHTPASLQPDCVHGLPSSGQLAFKLGVITWFPTHSPAALHPDCVHGLPSSGQPSFKLGRGVCSHASTRGVENSVVAVLFGAATQAAVSTPPSHKSNTCSDVSSTIGPGKSALV